MTDRLTVLILGGYGTFGGRLAQLLADEARLTLIIAGRSRASAEAFCKDFPAKASLVPLVFDRDGGLESQLRVAAPDIVVDASGPFQNYTGDPYRVTALAWRLASIISISQMVRTSSKASRNSMPGPKRVAFSSCLASAAFRS